MARHEDPGIIFMREVYTHRFPNIRDTVPPEPTGKRPGSGRR